MTKNINNDKIKQDIKDLKSDLKKSSGNENIEHINFNNTNKTMQMIIGLLSDIGGHVIVAIFFAKFISKQIASDKTKSIVTVVLVIFGLLSGVYSYLKREFNNTKR